MNAKEEVAESLITKLYLKQLKIVREKLEAKDSEIQAHKTMMELQAMENKQMYKTIEDLKMELKTKIRDIEMEQVRFDFKYKKMQNEYKQAMKQGNNSSVEYKALVE